MYNVAESRVSVVVKLSQNLAATKNIHREYAKVACVSASRVCSTNYDSVPICTTISCHLKILLKNRVNGSIDCGCILIEISFIPQYY